MTSFIAQLDQLNARKTSAARKLFLGTVPRLAAGDTFTDAELTAVGDALTRLNKPASELDQLAGLYAAYPTLRAAFAAIPSADQRAAEKAKLQEELVTAEGRLVVAQRTGQMSSVMTTDLAALRGRFHAFGREDEQLQYRFHDVTNRLSEVLAAHPIPETEPAAAPKPTSTSKAKATAVAK